MACRGTICRTRARPCHWPGRTSRCPPGSEIRTYAKGLALRSRTELAYRLPAGMRRFAATAGIDPATAAPGARRAGNSGRRPGALGGRNRRTAAARANRRGTGSGAPLAVARRLWPKPGLWRPPAPGRSAGDQMKRMRPHNLCGATAGDGCRPACAAADCADGGGRRSGRAEGRARAHRRHRQRQRRDGRRVRRPPAPAAVPACSSRPTASRSPTSTSSPPAAPAMKCGLTDGKLYDAVIVGIDPVGDVALIQLLGRDDFPIAEIGDSDAVRDGRLGVRRRQSVPAGRRLHAVDHLRPGLGRAPLPVSRRHAAGIHRLPADRRRDQPRQLRRAAVRRRRAGSSASTAAARSKSAAA